MRNNIVPIKSKEEEIAQQEKLSEIVILLEQLFKREDATAKRIIECLYDIARVNLINKYVRLFPLNSFLKFIFKFPKPLARNLALKYYVQPKCPVLITDWLYTLVEFKEIEKLEEAIIIETENIERQFLPEMRKNQREIKSLRKKVRLLTGTLVMTIAIFGGSFAFMAKSLELTPSQMLNFSESKNIQVK